MSEVIDGLFSIWGNSADSKYKILRLIQAIPIEHLNKETMVKVLKQAKIDAEIEVRTDENKLLIQYRIMELAEKCESCGKRSTYWSKPCGALVCSCGHHKGLARCFCGWNMQAGERLPDDIGNAKLDADGFWEVDY